MLNQQEISFNATTFSPCQLESKKCIFFYPEIRLNRIQLKCSFRVGSRKMLIGLQRQAARAGQVTAAARGVRSPLALRFAN